MSRERLSAGGVEGRGLPIASALTHARCVTRRALVFMAVAGMSACGGSGGSGSFVGGWTCSITITTGSMSGTGQQEIFFSESQNGLKENFNGTPDGGSSCEIVMPALSGSTATLASLTCNGVTLSNIVEVVNGDTFTITAGYSPPSGGSLNGTCTRL
jgi:hypothetical protein